jgi:hypothetical protein
MHIASWQLSQDFSVIDNNLVSILVTKPKVFRSVFGTKISPLHCIRVLIFVIGFPMNYQVSNNIVKMFDYLQFVLVTSNSRLRPSLCWPCFSTLSLVAFEVSGSL